MFAECEIQSLVILKSSSFSVNLLLGCHLRICDPPKHNKGKTLCGWPHSQIQYLDHANDGSAKKEDLFSSQQR